LLSISSIDAFRRKEECPDASSHRWRRNRATTERSLPPPFWRARKGEERFGVALGTLLLALCSFFCTRCIQEIFNMLFQALKRSKMTRKGEHARWSIGIESSLLPLGQQFRPLCALENSAPSLSLSSANSLTSQTKKRTLSALSLQKKRERGCRGVRERKRLVRPSDVTGSFPSLVKQKKSAFRELWFFFWLDFFIFCFASPETEQH